MRAFVSRYCEEECGGLLPSQRQCHAGDCHLKKFADKYLDAVPAETMDAVGHTMKQVQLKNCLLALDWAKDFIADTAVEGSNVVVTFKDGVRPLPPGLPLVALYHCLVKGPSFTNIVLYRVTTEGRELILRTTRARAIELVGHEGYEKIRADWKSVWDWFRQAREGDPDFIEAVRRYLAGDEVPVRFKYMEQMNGAFGMGY